MESDEATSIGIHRVADVAHLEINAMDVRVRESREIESSSV